ncbi:MAG: hypothetical protein FH749_12555 [Firmicutes bacterium]|nr:hypothetical protein [Bacillota bacterium]
MEQMNCCEPTPFITTNVLEPVGPASQLFISGVSIFEITIFEPPLQRVTLVAINLPDPDTFGPFDQYVATLEIPGESAPQEEIVLLPTPDEAVWAGSTLLTFGGTLPTINAFIRPQLNGVRVGPVILQGRVVSAE